MDKKLDTEKVATALKRAAAAALSGKREAQSGRFTAVSSARKEPTAKFSTTKKK